MRVVLPSGANRTLLSSTLWAVADPLGKIDAQIHCGHCVRCTKGVEVDMCAPRGDRDGAIPRRIGALRHAEACVRYDEPSWSPDGARISYTSGSGGIWIMNADGTGLQGPVIANGRQGSWAIDGLRVAF